MSSKEKELLLEVLKKKSLKERNKLEKFNCLSSEYVSAERNVLILERIVKNMASDLYSGKQCSFF